MASKPVVICGAGGFIGGHLVKALIGQRPIRAVDIKPLGQWYQVFPEAENLVLDLRLKQNCVEAARGADTIYNLAADMGGMGFIENNKALCMLSVLINTHLLLAAKDEAYGGSFSLLSPVRTTSRSQRPPKSSHSKIRTPTPRCPRTVQEGR